jgi:hypothetical protein
MNCFLHEQVSLPRHGHSRRGFLRQASAAAVAGGVLGFRDRLGLQAAELRKQGRALILLWMSGGPSQFETFDPKPGTENGGPTESIETSVSGIRIARGWEQTAKVMDDIALIRSMTNKEGNHQRATYQLHTGYIPSGSVKHPSLAANIARELAASESELPAIVSVGLTQGAGFLGVDYEPFVVREPGKMPENVAPGLNEQRYRRQLGLIRQLGGEFAAVGGALPVQAHHGIYEKASRMSLSPSTSAFDISSEPESLKRQYGETQFGRGCLLARRLVEAGVTCIEVRSNGWDTHQNNFTETTRLAGEVDPAMAALITDLKQRGLLETTVVMCIGEFGRTPRITPRVGRDHYPRVFSAAVAGGGMRAGQVIGASTSDGTAIADRPVTVNDLFTTVCAALHVDPAKENISPLGRPMKIVDGGEAMHELMG